MKKLGLLLGSVLLAAGLVGCGGEKKAARLLLYYRKIINRINSL